MNQQEGLAWIETWEGASKNFTKKKFQGKNTGERSRNGDSNRGTDIKLICHGSVLQTGLMGKSLHTRGSRSGQGKRVSKSPIICSHGKCGKKRGGKRLGIFPRPWLRKHQRLFKRSSERKIKNKPRPRAGRKSHSGKNTTPRLKMLKKLMRPKASWAKKRAGNVNACGGRSGSHFENHSRENIHIRGKRTQRKKKSDCDCDSRMRRWAMLRNLRSKTRWGGSKE